MRTFPAQVSATAFAQLRSSANNNPEARGGAEFLQAKTEKWNSRCIALMALREEGKPFLKVKKKNEGPDGEAEGRDER